MSLHEFLLTPWPIAFGVAFVLTIVFVWLFRGTVRAWVGGLAILTIIVALLAWAYAHGVVQHG
jgi:hypothetical protein